MHLKVFAKILHYTKILRFVDGRQIDNDTDLKDDVLITNDSFGSYLSFPRQRAGDVFKKGTLNVTCKAATFEGERSHSISVGKF